MAGRGHDVSLSTSENCFGDILGESLGVGRTIGVKGVGRFFGGTRGLFKARSTRDNRAFGNIGLIPLALSLALAGDGTAWISWFRGELEYRRRGSLPEDGAMERGTFTIEDVWSGEIGLSWNTSSSIGGESGSGIAAASIPKSSRLLDTWDMLDNLDFRPGYLFWLLR